MASHTSTQSMTNVISDEKWGENSTTSIDTAAQIQLEMVARLNNMGVACVESSELPEAGQFFKRSLKKANEMTFFGSLAQSATLPTNQDDSTNGGGVSKNLYIYQRGEYDEGMHTFANPIRINAELSTIHTATATILFNLGQIQVRLNDNEEAERSFVRACQVEWSSSGGGCSLKAKTGGVSIMAILHNIGNVQYRMGRYEDAIKSYSKALDLCRGSYVESSHQMLEVAATLNCLGVLYFHLPKADTEKAMAYYQESLAISRAVLGQDAVTKEIATTINNIGRIHYMKGEHTLALEVYSEALTMRKSLFGNNHLDVAATVYNAGQTFHQCGNLDKAMELYGQFLAIAKSRLGYQHRDVAIMLKCMVSQLQYTLDVESIFK